MKRAGGIWLTARHQWRVWLRRSAQILGLSGFIWLTWAMATNAAQQYDVPRAADIIFLCDPLVFFAACVAGSCTLSLAVTGVLAILGALLIGRAFCGWLCPLGTTLDMMRRVTEPIAGRWRRNTQRRTGRWATWCAQIPLWIAIMVVMALLVGLNVVGLVDPFAIVMRGLTTSIFPLIEQGHHALHDWLRPAVDHVPAPGFLDDYRFIGAPVRQTVAQYGAAGVSAITLGVVLAMEVIQARWWCRTVCPTGSVLGVLARWSLVRRLPGKTCGPCRVCVHSCHMGAFTDQGILVPSACTACLSCVEDCPTGVAALQLPTEKTPTAPIDISRRGFLTACAAGATLPLLPAVRTPSSSAMSTLVTRRLRPPGVAAAGSDTHFLDACIRCSECVRVCPTQGLQPMLLADGMAGLFAPRLVPREGPCEYDCSACAQVCPSGAIPLLDLVTKQKAKLGRAIHDHQRCLPWSGGGECRACWEHCPAPKKAITLTLGHAPNGQAIPLPGVDAERCIGCGTCEFVCPIEGEAGIRVVTLESVAQEQRRLQSDIKVAS